MKIRLADYVAEFLAKNQINTVFTVTGGGAMYLNDALGKHPKLKCYYNHHEQACAMAAEGYTRVSKKIAAVCVTTGPGGTNAITGVLGGYLDSIPMLIISGQVKFSTTVKSTGLPLRQLGDQEFDIVKLVSSMTKYAVMIENPLEVKYHLEKALFLAYHGRPGPSWLDIPINVQSAIIDTDELISFNPNELSNITIPVISQKTINDINDLINSAKKPLIMVGTGIKISSTEKEFLEFVEKSKIPVVTAFNAHDLIVDDHPQYVGRPGTVGERAGNFAVQNCDLLIVLGCRLSIRQISYNYENFAKKAKIIMIEIDKVELDKPTLKIDYPIWGDLRDFFPKINHIVKPIKSEKWMEYCQSLKKMFDVVDQSYYNTPKINPYVFARALAIKTPENYVSVTSNGSSVVITFQTAIIKKGQRLFFNGAVASMGYGLPASIGACIANGLRDTICLEGDGSLQMNIQELMTISKNKLPIKIFIYNNSGYHSIRQTQKNFFGTPLVGVGVDSNDLAFPDLEYIAKAYNLKFYRIKNDNDLVLIDDILKENVATLIDVVVDENQNFWPKLSSRQLPDGKLVSASLEDMYPFLDEDLVKKLNSI